MHADLIKCARALGDLPHAIMFLMHMKQENQKVITKEIFFICFIYLFVCVCVFVT